MMMTELTWPVRCVQMSVSQNGGLHCKALIHFDLRLSLVVDSET